MTVARSETWLGRLVQVQRDAGGARRPFALVSRVPLVCAWFILSFVVALVLFIVYMTFIPGLPFEGGFTLEHWASIWSSRLLNQVIPNTLIVGFGTVLVSCFFALPLAWLLNRTTLPCRTVFTTLIAIAVIVPGFIKAMGWIMLVSDRIGIVNQALAGLLGIENVPLSVMNSPVGMAWVMGLMFTPTLFFLISGPIRAMDPSLEEAAAVAGQTRWGTFWLVNLPLMSPGVLAGVIYIFMTAVSIFEVPALLGAASGRVPVLATELFYAARPGGPENVEIAYGVAGVYGLLIALPSMVALYFYLQLLTRAKHYEVITGKAYRPTNIELGRLKWAGLAFVVLYLLLAVVLPMLVLVWASLLPFLYMPSMETFSKVSLANYTELHLTLGGWQVLWNTLLLMSSVSLLVLFFSLMISWVVVRARVRMHKTMDLIAMVPHAIPGLAFAFALLMLAVLVSKWLPWIPFYGTLFIIVLANVVNRLSYGTRVTNAALVQIQSDLEECGQVCGLGVFGVIREIIVPLIKPSLIYAGFWTAMLTFREVTMALFLTESENRVLSVSIWYLWQGGNLSLAAAGAVAMVAIMGVIIFVTLTLSGRNILGQRGLGLDSTQGR